MKSRKKLIFYLLLYTSIAITIIFYFFARGINIEVSPQEISEQLRIRVEKGFGLKLDNRLILFPGEKSIILSAPGYYEKKHDFIVGGSSETLKIEMNEIPGNVYFEFNPPVIPEIIFNENRLNREDNESYQLFSGNYELEFKHPDIVTENKKILVEGFGKNQTLKITLKPKTSIIEFKASPIGSKVYVGDEYIGKVPFSKEIRAGSYEVTFKKGGYKDRSLFLKVEVNKDQSIDIGNMELLPGKLILSSDPSNATILLNNEYYGNTPSEVFLGPNIEHEISIMKEGYEPFRVSANLDSAQVKKIDITMTAILGKVTLNSSPQSEVLINEKFISKTPLSIDLITTPQKISFLRKDYRSKSMTITPSANNEAFIEIKLDTEEEARFKESPKRYKSANDHEFLLFKPGKITMGALRNEPGQRANEIIREASLTKPFYISEYEVTNNQFKRFSTRDANDRLISSDQNPVVNISWIQAAQYCNWLSKKEKLSKFYVFENGNLIKINYKSNGYRLPTEAEWAWISRSSEKGMLKFPWGDNMPVKSGSGNYADESAKVRVRQYIRNYNDGYEMLSPVGSFSANEKSIFDIGGNAREWMNDYYGFAAYNESIDPTGPASGTTHVIRGSGWKTSSLSELRLSYRDSLTGHADDVGFRVARWLEGKRSDN